MKTILLLTILSAISIAGSFEENNGYEDDNSAETVEATDDTTTNKKSLKHHRISFEFGFGNLTDDTDPDAPQWIKDYNGKLTSGQSLGVSWMGYWPKSGIGMGLCVSKYWASASMDNVGFIDRSSYPIDTIIGTMSDEISIIFFGMPLGLRKRGEKIEFSGDIRVGGLFYFDDYSFAGHTLSLSSPAFGFGGNLSLEYMLNKNVGLFVGLTGFSGSVKTLFVKNGGEQELPEPISLKRLDINLGLRIHFETESSENPYVDNPPVYFPPPFQR